MKTICILNLKGGVGKTTTAVSIAELLTTGFNCGKERVRPGKVLLLDNDKQGNASRLFEVFQNSTKERTAAAVLTDADTGQSIHHTKIKGLDIIPCNYFMELAELELKATEDTNQCTRYKDALLGISDKYDYCIVDNAPDLGINVINALTATDEIIIPVNLDCYALNGLEELVTQVENIKQLNRKAHIAGILITDYEKTETSEAAETWLRTKSNIPVFYAIIRHSKKVSDSTFYKKTPIAYSVRSGAAQGYKKFTLELMQQLEESEVRNGI